MGTKSNAFRVALLLKSQKIVASICLFKKSKKVKLLIFGKRLIIANGIEIKLSAQSKPFSVAAKVLKH